MNELSLAIAMIFGFVVAYVFWSTQLTRKAQTKDLSHQILERMQRQQEQASGIKQEHSEREIRTRTVAPFSQAAAVVAARAAAAASQLHTTRNDISSLLQSHSELNGPCAVVQVGGAKWQGLVNVPETSTVAQLKIRIGLISAIAPRVQELIYRGRKLSDPGVALHSLGIRKNKRSRVLLRARRSINSTCT